MDAASGYRTRCLFGWFTSTSALRVRLEGKKDPPLRLCFPGLIGFDSMALGLLGNTTQESLTSPGIVPRDYVPGSDIIRLMAVVNARPAGRHPRHTRQPKERIGLHGTPLCAAKRAILVDLSRGRTAELIECLCFLCFHNNKKRQSRL